MSQNHEPLLSRDKRWQASSTDNTSLEEFVAILPKIHFYENVNQDVKAAFNIVHKLLIHSMKNRFLLINSFMISGNISFRTRCKELSNS